LSGDVITIDSTAFQTSININLNVTVTLQDVMFNANSTYGSTAMELDVTEQTSFVIKTLFYFGVVVKDPQIIQVAARQILQEENNKKRLIRICQIQTEVNNREQRPILLWTTRVFRRWCNKIFFV